MTKSYYPVEESHPGEPVRTSVRLAPELHADVELISELWNEIDKKLGAKRPRKWVAARVIERLIEVGVADFWKSIGGRPDEQEERSATISRAVKHVSTRR